MLRRVVSADTTETIERPSQMSPQALTQYIALPKPLEPLGAAEIARLDAAALAR